MLLGSIVLGLAVGPANGAATERTSKITLAQLVGQHVMAAYAGARPSAALLGRIERGEIGSIILFGGNIPSVSTAKAAIAQMQDAARKGGRPPLLIATDQEGGIVKRLPAGPPFQSAADMGAAGSASKARRVGLATGRYLRSVGINVDLAPVLDVPDSNRSFLGSRAFGRDPGTVERVGVPFASGIESAGVAATAKHFPGLGTAHGDTDSLDVSVTTSRKALMRRLAPFTAVVKSGIRLVMVSGARYPALDSARLPAQLSPTIVYGLLRGRLRFRGVVITDTMGGPSVASYTDAPVRAVEAGVDILLYTSEQMAAAAYDKLLHAARAGTLTRQELLSSYDRVLRLKRWIQQTRRG